MTAAFVTVKASVTRVTGTTQYAPNELVADSGTGSLVTPLKFHISRTMGEGIITRVKLWKSTSTFALADFRVHFFTSAPTFTNGDNGAFVVASSRTWVGKCDLYLSANAFIQSGVAKFSVPTDSDDVPCSLGFDLRQVAPNARILYGALETLSAYSPGDSEIFEVDLDLQGESR